ncbi:MAG: hypothetical protein JWM35_2218 [Verrucomicrobia bacterium]|nr:hypothetical protein [Verrucomicrobiota bacterium]
MDAERDRFSRVQPHGSGDPCYSVLEPPWRPTLRAAQANLVPGIVIWSVGFTLVLAYYNIAPVHAALGRLTELRARTGFLFPAVSTALCGAVLPILYLRSDPALRADYRFKNCVLLIVFWAYKGVEIELWYRVLAHFVGNNQNVRTVAIKVFLDQAIYSPFFAVPLTVLVFSFTHVGLRFGPIKADLRAGGWYRRHVLPTVLANAVIWIPVVCLVYALPLPLQIVLFDLVLCFFILIAAHITRRRR